MKKIISLLSIFAIIATMFTTVAMADDNNYVDWTIEEHTANKITFLVYAQTNQQIDGVTVSFTLNKFNTTYGLMDDDFTVEALNGATVNARTSATGGAAANKNVLSFVYARTDGTKTTGRLDLGRISIDLTDVKEFPLTNKKFVVSGEGGDLTATFTNKLAGQTIAPKADEGFKPAAGGDMVNPATGKTEQTYLTDIVEFNTDETAPSITIKDEAGETKTFDGDWYPTNLKGQGTIKVLVIVRYAGATEKTFSIVNE